MFRVAAIHQDEPFGATMSEAVDREIEDLAHRPDLELTSPGPPAWLAPPVSLPTA
ncbi:hypothetical protein [Streptomyces sp. TRM68367]|uniref:hypothetical protein n=1 Tax=Streptomyces sp. TRM68367 TaxID=2758415 RepID=UPI00165B752B|nr:hypothetical protein [Streptomyces sp. TRM68367]MBC9725903.1 hypothetical protein [Streptomyces sp. TRM68367]